MTPIIWNVCFVCVQIAAACGLDRKEGKPSHCGEDDCALYKERTEGKRIHCRMCKDPIIG